MTFHGRRSMRGDPPETDPRFRARAAVGPQRNNWGSPATLLGSNPGGAAKLIKIADDANSSFLVSVNTIYTGAVGLTPSNGVSVKGIFGSGGAVNSVEFDAKPDVTVQLPGGAIDLDVSWSTSFAIAGTVLTESVNANLLPARADVQAVACKGEQARGRATKTQVVTGLVASNVIIPCPRFADEFMWYGDQAGGTGYANLTSLAFMSGTDPTTAQVLADYTQAQLLALKAAGMTVPIPGIASGMRVITTGAITGYATYFLSL